MSVSSPKRIKLEIGHQGAEKRLTFTLSDLMGDILIRESSEITLPKVQEKGEKWVEKLSGFEQAFWDHYNEAVRTLRTAAGEQNLKADTDIRNFVLSSPRWKQMIDSAADTLMKDVGEYIYDFSDDLLDEFLPGKDTEFYRVFDEIMDQPTLEALKGDPDEAWLRIPLLQIRIEPALLCVPWWLARTYDESSLWCSRYALAVSPTLGETKPPSVRLDVDTGVHILSITRPTFDLRAWPSISPETISTAYPFIKDGRLSWRHMDGLSGNTKFTVSNETSLHKRFEQTGEFKGINKRQVRDALSVKDQTPNVILYQGHWYNYQFNNTQDKPPYIFLNDGSRSPVKVDDPTRPIIADLHLPVPLLTLIPPGSQNKILIMNGCSSGAPNQADYIEHYVLLHSAFVGTNYPILTDSAASSSDRLMQALLKNQFLAHSVLEANRLNTTFQEDSCDFAEIYKKAALCLFGDVRTNLFKQYRSDSSDNLSQLTLKLTNRWDAGLTRLGLRDYKGMTFVTEPTDLSPTGMFALTDEGVQMALAPLVVAVDLCIHSPGSYVILGPAFSSRESVALISKLIPDWKGFGQTLQQRIDTNKRIKLGVLIERLTSTYMVWLMLKDAIAKQYGPERAGEIMRNHVKHYFAHWKGEGDTETLMSDEFLEKVDLTLSLNRTADQLKLLGFNVLESDLETRTTRLLNMEVNELPRGILITRRKCFESIEGRPAIIEFCNAFNEGVSRTRVPTEGDVPEDIPLPTFDRADPKQLRAIQAFACTEFFSERSFGWENFSHRPSDAPSTDDLRSIVSGLPSATWSEESLRVRNLDPIAIADSVNALISKLTEQLDRRVLWNVDEFQNLFENLARRSSLPDPVQKDASKHISEKLDQLKSTVVQVS